MVGGTADTHPVRRPTLLVALVSGALAVLVAGGPAGAQVTVPTLPSTTTSSTTSSTTAASSTTTTSGTSTTSSSTTTTTTAPAGPAQSSGLTITLPGTAQLSAGTSLSAPFLSGQLGTVTVSDSRGSLLSPSSWVATVSTTGFTNEDEPDDEVEADDIAYWSGPAMTTTGPALVTPGQLTSLLAESLGTPQQAFRAIANTGSSSVSWNPTIVVTLRSGLSPGDYRGTITHSVG